MVAAPSLFLSHGSPSIMFENSQARDFLVRLGAEIGKPDAIVVASAHFETADATITSGKAPEIIFDFRSPRRELFSTGYDAPGSPKLARDIRRRLNKQGIAARLDSRRGLDQGAWVPLHLMYPDADVPVCQISIQPGRGPAYHLRLGAALRSLRDEGVMVIGSGCATHNLTELHTRGYAHDTDAPQWVIAFSEWVHDNVEAGNIDALLNYRELAPYAVDNHPTQEHFMPLFVAAGAGAEPKGTLVHASHTYGVLAMDAYRFD